MLLLLVGATVEGLAASSRADGLCEIEQITGAFPEGIVTFGTSVTIRGDFAAVGTIGQEIDDEGSAHVYRVTESGLMLQEVRHSGVIACRNFFGTSMATDGSVLAVGDTGEATAGCQSGAVYVYRIENGAPAFEQKLTASNGHPAARFGRSVAAWADTILVGASGHATNGLDTAGAAYVFRHEAGRWIEEAMLVDPVPEQYAVFGLSVSLVNDLAMVGANADDGPAINTGAALVFRFGNGRWNFEQELKPSDGGPDSFGTAVALDGAGNTAVIGAPNSLGQVGSAYVFEYNGSKWVETAMLVAGDPVGLHPGFGGAVAISEDGESILIGAVGDSEAGFEAGAAHFFRRIGNDWVEVFKFVTPGTACLGSRVALDGDVALISDLCNASGGSVYRLAGVQGTDCNGNGEPDSCDIATGFSLDADGNGVPDECAVFGDLDGDGQVGIVDFLTVLGTWGPCPAPCPPACPGDLDGDCTVGVTDFLALLGAWTLPPPAPECPGRGDCCAVNGSAGCDDPACCDAVCAADPFCCDVTWDMVCVDAAQTLCGCAGPETCGVSTAGNCCAFGGLSGPGCSDAGCCEAICQYVDPFCCQVQWDSGCTAWALQFCQCPPAACNPDAGSCCTANGSPGCNDIDCCALVCEQIDPFCCDAAWDAICASIASDLCEVCGG